MKNLHEIGIEYEPWHLRCPECGRWFLFTPTSAGVNLIPKVNHITFLGGDDFHYLDMYDAITNEYTFTAQQQFA